MTQLDFWDQMFRNTAFLRAFQLFFCQVKCSFINGVAKCQIQYDYFASMPQGTLLALTFLNVSAFGNTIVAKMNVSQEIFFSLKIYLNIFSFYSE